MKNLLATTILFLATTATASVYQLPKGSLSLSLLTEGQYEVVTKVPNCPAGAMCDPAAVLTIKFTLKGCMDKLGPVTINYAGRNEDGKMKYIVSALNIHNKASMTTKCFRAPIGEAKQVIGMGFYGPDDIEVEFAQGFVSTTTY